MAKRGLLIAVTVAAALAAGDATAKKGGGGKPGGDPPPADPDPAIVYAQHDGPGTWGLYVMDANGANQTLVASDTGSSGLTAPTWSPDGTRIAYVGLGGLYVVNRDGTGAERIVAGSVFEPQWSPAAAPDGKQKIAFMQPRDGEPGPDVWLVNPDGTGLQNLTDTVLRTESYPAWSPDATRLAIAFANLERDANGSLGRTAAGLVVLNLTTGSSAPLEIASIDTVIHDGTDPDRVSIRLLDWARTSDRLAYCSRDVTGDPFDLWTVDLANPVPTRLTNTADVDERDPSWAPDDSRIVFGRTGQKKEAKRSGIYTILPDGSGLTSLGAKEGVQPDWLR